MDLNGDFLPGIIGELDISVIQKAKQMYFNFILNYLKELEVPDTDFRNGLAIGHINNNTAFVQEAPNNIDLVTNQTINAVRLSAKNLKIGFKSNDFHYKLGLIVAKGSIDALLSNVTLNISVSLSS